MEDTWKMAQSECPECGKTVYNVGKHKNQFCSKQCETNNKFRKKRFTGTEADKWISAEDVKKFK